MCFRKQNIKKLEKQVVRIRRDILEISHQAGVGHIASALCVADILAVLYNGILNINPKNSTDPGRDRFLLSKGHAVAALLAVLYNRGFINKKMLRSYCLDGGEFGMHPEQNIEYGIEFSTGSLGHGLSVGAGMALGLRGKARVFVLLSDAELNAGSTWEAVMFASHHGLDNLVAIVDNNSLQAFGRTKEILNLHSLQEKWSAFGWKCREADGHNIEELYKLLRKVPFTAGKPNVVIAKTVAGKGVSFMEDKLEWHYWPMSKKQYQRATKELSGC